MTDARNGIGGNNPPILLELSPELAAFLWENCNTNIGFGLGNLQSLSREGAEQMVTLIENFKGVREGLKKAGFKPDD